MFQTEINKRNKDLITTGGATPNPDELVKIDLVTGRPFRTGLYLGGCACLSCTTARMSINLTRRQMLLGDISAEERDLIRFSGLGMWPEAIQTDPLSDVKGGDEKIPKSEFWMIITDRKRKKIEKKEPEEQETDDGITGMTIQNLQPGTFFNAEITQTGRWGAPRPRQRNPEPPQDRVVLEYKFVDRWVRSATWNLRWDASKSIKTLLKEYREYLCSCAYCKRTIKPFGRRLMTTSRGTHTYRLCEKCMNDDNFYTCQFCERSYIPTNPGRYKEFGDRRYTCRACSEDARYCDRCDCHYNAAFCPDCDRPNGLHRHNYTPKFTPLVTDGELKDYTKVMTGIELEMGSRTAYDAHRIARDVNSQPGLYCVHDGSITRDNPDLGVGVEVVSMPFSKAYWEEQLRSRLSRLLRQLMSNYDMEAYEHFSCGMHVHISRASFTPARLYKLIYLLTKNPSWSYKVGQRDETNWTERYCSFNKEAKTTKDLIDKACGYPGDPQPPLVNNNFGGGDGDPHKYVAINTTGSRSIELRIFKGTLNMRAIEKNLEFVWAIHDWAGVASNSELNIPHFLDFLKTHRKMYPHLFEYMRALRQYPGAKGDSFIPLYEGDK